jgi:hypothetical protein
MPAGTDSADRAQSTHAAGSHGTRRPAPAGSPDAEVGVQRLLDAWSRATLAERNTFLWLAAEEIQAALEGEFQNTLTTPQAPGNSPSVRPRTDHPARERAPDHLSSADLAAVEQEAIAWLEEEAEQARLWRDDEASAQARGVPMPWERMKRSFAPRTGREEGPG